MTTGFAVNGVSGGSRATCVHGYLQGVDWTESNFVFYVVTEGDAARIDSFRPGRCDRPR